MIFNKKTVSETKNFAEMSSCTGVLQRYIFIALHVLTALFCREFIIIACWKSKVLLHKLPLKNILKNKFTCNYMFSKIHSCYLYFTDKLTRQVLETGP